MIAPLPRMGVAIAAFRSASFIADCLDSLFASDGARLRVVVTDNASDDPTVEVVREWAAARQDLSFAEGAVGEMARAEADLTLLRAPVNRGFAYATNRGLELLQANPAIDLFWLLNPDCQVRPDTAARFAAAGADGSFALMGGRTVYLADPGRVQADGGSVSLSTGVCRLINMDRPASEAAAPGAGETDFVTGASCVASRRFVEAAGLLPEDYFLYYEEVDWAQRRGHLPLRIVPQAITMHYGGATIGSGAPGRRASAFANYFNYRNRMRFVRRYAPRRLPIARVYALAKAGQLALLGAGDEARAVLAGTLELAPPDGVRSRLDPAAQEFAFAPAAR